MLYTAIQQYSKPTGRHHTRDASITMHIEGLDAFIQQLAALGKGGKIKNVMRRVMGRVGNLAKDVIVQNTPVYTGVLASSWYVTRNENGNVIGACVGVRDKTVSPTDRGPWKATRRMTAGQRQESAALLANFSKPKNPILYASKVNQNSRLNAGFFDRACREAMPLCRAAFDGYAEAEIAKEYQKLGIR